MLRHGSLGTMLHLRHEHPWDVSPTQARETQQRLSRLVETTDRLGDIGTVAGVDVDVGSDLENALTRAGVKPIYVSCGNRVSLETAVDLVMRCTTRYRLPETTRRADRAASGR